MRFEAEQFEFNLMEENAKLKKENKLLREQFINVANAIHNGEKMVVKAVVEATRAVENLEKQDCQTQNGSA
ncbi:MAG: hypothetical protein EBZ61_10230 [Micrococcales bacterium]|jgi:regulator of replication initiation timing|nr:hypothetical protein [Micrococcales bacterium]